MRKLLLLVFLYGCSKSGSNDTEVNTVAVNRSPIKADSVYISQNWVHAKLGSADYLQILFNELPVSNSLDTVGDWNHLGNHRVIIGLQYEGVYYLSKDTAVLVTTTVQNGVKSITVPGINLYNNGQSISVSGQIQYK